MHKPILKRVLQINQYYVIPFLVLWALYLLGPSDPELDCLCSEGVKEGNENACKQIQGMCSLATTTLVKATEMEDWPKDVFKKPSVVSDVIAAGELNSSIEISFHNSGPTSHKYRKDKNCFAKEGIISKTSDKSYRHRWTRGHFTILLLGHIALIILQSKAFSGIVNFGATQNIVDALKRVNDGNMDETTRSMQLKRIAKSLVRNAEFTGQIYFCVQSIGIIISFVQYALIHWFTISAFSVFEQFSNVYNGEGINWEWDNYSPAFPRVVNCTFRTGYYESYVPFFTVCKDEGQFTSSIMCKAPDNQYNEYFYLAFYFWTVLQCIFFTIKAIMSLFFASALLMAIEKREKDGSIWTAIPFMEWTWNLLPGTMRKHDEETYPAYSFFEIVFINNFTPLIRHYPFYEEFARMVEEEHVQHMMRGVFA